MFNKLFDMYNILDVDKLYAFWLHFGLVKNEHELKNLFKETLYFCRLDIGYLLKVYCRTLYLLVKYRLYDQVPDTINVAGECWNSA